MPDQTAPNPQSEDAARDLARRIQAAQTPDAKQPRPFIRSRGLKIPKHPQLTTGRIRGDLRNGTYERKECDAVMRVVREGDRVLELGGGIGYMSTLLSVKKKVAKVVTYEANPSLIPFITKVHCANGVANVDLRNALLTPAGGAPVPFHIRENFLASSMDYDAEPDTVVDTVSIDQHAIAPVIDDLTPDILVCDIEGAESDLLPAGDWSGLRAAIIELHPQWIGPSGVRAVFDAMHRGGLTYFPKASEGKVVTFRRAW
ncbi:MAG: FkbM family methyltransferase [Pelagimonas sp.]|jgi:FkbM family methyltransferase|nr:FkbM family methyltransferase [Pelagimonas sp.]